MPPAARLLVGMPRPWTELVQGSPVVATRAGRASGGLGATGNRRRARREWRAFARTSARPGGPRSAGREIVGSQHPRAAPSCSSSVARIDSGRRAVLAISGPASLGRAPSPGLRAWTASPESRQMGSYRLAPDSPESDRTYDVSSRAASGPPCCAPSACGRTTDETARRAAAPRRLPHRLSPGTSAPAGPAGARTSYTCPLPWWLRSCDLLAI
jgi:hypothetical protein